MTFIRFNYAPRRIEELSEDKTFPDHELASLVCSKVYYHLGAFDVALRFALGAGKLFDVNQVWSLHNFNLHTFTKCQISSLFMVPELKGINLYILSYN